ncbi:MAG: hypothetical protein OXG44_12050 [Gammaproteobacteria bacterium]|nr:hypothetical protein [Gammaproteobacteria bacterium]
MRSEPMMVLTLLVFVAGSATALGGDAPADSDAGCAEWNTEGFFKNASVEEIAACLEAGADPNALDQHGRPLLHLASKFTPDAGVVAALVKAGADPNAGDTRG